MTRNLTARLATPLFMIASLGLAAPALAGVEERLGMSFGVDWTNAYFFHGVLQEREGIILQPYAEYSWNFYSAEDGFIQDVTGAVGGWWSLHSERTGANESPQWFYEGDYYASLSLGFDGGVSLGASYTFLTSPNDAFPTQQEANVTLAWDDSEAFGAWSMQPYMNVTIETNRTLLGDDEGVGLQLGVEPTLYATESESFTLTMPAELGLAIDDFYESSSGGENIFGYANVGFAAAIPLSFIPEKAGAWSLGLSAKYFFFSSTLEKLNRGRSTYPVGTLSIGVEF